MKDRVVVFDVGGVLINLDFEGMFERMALKSDLPAEVIRSHFWPERSVHGESNETLLAKATAGRIESEDLIETVHSVIKFKGSLGELTSLYHSLFLSRIEGTLQIFNELRETSRIGILSNTNAWSWPGAARQLPELQNADKIFLSYKLNMVKPDPKLFNHVADSFEIPIEQLIFIDDSDEIVERARMAGVDALQFTSPEQLQIDLYSRGFTTISSAHV